VTSIDKPEVGIRGGALVGWTHRVSCLPSENEQNEIRA